MKIKLDPGAYMPERAHSADAGYDLRSPFACLLLPAEPVVINLEETDRGANGFGSSGK